MTAKQLGIMADASDNTCIEFLRPKTIPEQLIALGTVSQISDIQVRLQITGGIVCLVDRFNISQPYSKLLQDSTQTNKTPTLSQLFKKGEQYVCKIIDKQTRKGYADAQDIIATLDPNQIQEDSLPATLLSIPQMPLQCAIESIEDHGYRVDMGLKGLTGFLLFDEADRYCSTHNGGRKFNVGQIIRCCTKDPVSAIADARVVQLSMRKELMKSSAFSCEKVSNYVLTERCILPGSKGFSTVMKVQRDGLIVNFLNEFSGFVNLDHLKSEWHNPKEHYKISDQLECTVLYYNGLTNTFALSLKPKARSKKILKCFAETFHLGQIIKQAEVAHLNGTKSVVFRIDDVKAVAHVRDALDEDVSTMTKDELHLALDSAYPDNSRHKCRIKSINYADLLLVVSLRKDFLDFPFISVEELNPADFIEATVKKHVKDGVVVSFGLNLRAIILNSHLHDYMSAKSYKKYPIGKKIKCRVLKVDSSKYPTRVYLTNKEKLMDPEMTIVDSYDKTFRGETINAMVSKLKHDGIIVELFNNVKGFIPSRFCSSVPIRSIGDIFEEGQVVSCTIYRVEPGRQSLMLGIIPIEKIVEMKREKKKKKKNVSQSEQLDQENEMDVIDDMTNEITEKPVRKTRLQRSKEAQMREEKIRETENMMLDPNRPAQSVFDFERLILKSPNSADVWIRYSKFFLDNVETEKARKICQRALATINFRMEKEKLKVWMHLIKIEAKFGGSEKLHETIGEAAQTNDRVELYRGAAKVLVSCGELDEAERLHEMLLKLGSKSKPDIWLEYVLFIMEQRKDMDRARKVFGDFCKRLTTADSVYARSRFARLEFVHGDVERGKTMFENLLSEYPKRMDLWRVYEAAIRKFGTRQFDTDQVRQQNEQILERIASIKK